MPFEFASAGRLLFGAGTSAQLHAIAAAFGKRLLFLSGAHFALQTAPLLDALQGRGFEVTPFVVTGEPTIDLVRAGVAAGREAACTAVIACGGGSVLDTGKAVAALLANDGDILDYLEVIGGGRALAQPSLPCIVLPTTAGTGTEVTRNAVILSPEHRVKVSLRSILLLPRVAIVDPELTYSLPPAPTAATGLDALTQLIEPFVSARANALVDALCRDGIPLIARHLETAYRDGGNAAAREAMSLAACYGGLALANAGLGAVHGFAGVLGGYTGAPHGAVCARLLPTVMAVNADALRARRPDSDRLARYRNIACLLTGRPAATLADGITFIRELCARLAIPPLSAYGIISADFPALITQAAEASSMKANPITLTPEEMWQVLENSL